MAPPNLTASTRYFDPETTVVYYLPAIAAADLTPTRLEMDAGTNITGELRDLSGWTVTSEEIETPDMGSRFTSKIPGRRSAEDSNLTLYADINGTDVRDLLPRDTTGYIMWCDGGDTAGNKADVFPIRVRSVPKQRSTSDAALIQVQFSVTSEPAEDVTVPA